MTDIKPFLFLIKKMDKFIILISLVLLSSVYHTEQAHFLSKDYVNNINKAAKTWKAKQNFPENTSIEQILQIVGSKQLPGIPESRIIKENDELYTGDDEIPVFFDARLQWENCKTIGQVRNQGNCRSSWAHGTTGAFADRLCIAKNGTFDELLSADELTFCCHSCGFGCQGGDALKAWKHFKRHGVVTGGNYNTTDGCQPYRVPPCVHDEQGHNSCDGKRTEHNHICRRKCYGDNTVNYMTDHYKTKDAYKIRNVTIMQKDTMAYGPISVEFNIYEDFLSYKSGVYYVDVYETKFISGGHVAKLIGWGVEDDIPYWLVVNSWGEQWGDNGMFKIRRGTNECGIEDEPAAGVPCA